MKLGELLEGDFFNGYIKSGMFIFVSLLFLKMPFPFFSALNLRGTLKGRSYNRKWPSFLEEFLHRVISGKVRQARLNKRQCYDAVKPHKIRLLLPHANN